MSSFDPDHCCVISAQSQGPPSIPPIAQNVARMLLLISSTRQVFLNERNPLHLHLEWQTRGSDARRVPCRLDRPSLSPLATATPGISQLDHLGEELQRNGYVQDFCFHLTALLPAVTQGPWRSPFCPLAALSSVWLLCTLLCAHRP